MKKIYVTYYTKEKGKLEFDKKEWIDFPYSSFTFHREDGPAVIYSDGSKEYWLNGKYHREDGPAIVYANGDQEYYWLNDIFYLEKDYYKKLEEIDNLPLSLKLIHEEEWIRKRAKK